MGVRVEGIVSGPSPYLGNGLPVLARLGQAEDGRLCLQHSRPFGESLEWELVNSASDQVYPSSGLTALSEQAHFFSRAAPR
jgi:hypothetical protein